MDKLNTKNQIQIANFSVDFLELFKIKKKEKVILR